MKTKCAICGKKADADTDKCRGCGNVVCAACALLYGHAGEQGHRIPRKSDRSPDAVWNRAIMRAAKEAGRKPRKGETFDHKTAQVIAVAIRALRRSPGGDK